MGRPDYSKIVNFSDLRRLGAKLINQRNRNEINSTLFNDLLKGLRAQREFIEAEFLHSDSMRILAALEGRDYVPPPPSGFDEDEDSNDEREGLNGSEGRTLTTETGL